MIDYLEENWSELADTMKEMRGIIEKSGDKYSDSQILDLAKHFQLVDRLEALRTHLGEIEDQAKNIELNTDSLSSHIDDITEAIKNLRSGS